MSEINWSIPRRQSWVAVLLLAIRFLKIGYKVFGVILISVLLKGKLSFLWLTLALIIILLLFFVAALLQFWFYKFRLADGILEVNQGLFFKKRTHLPLIQIQSVHADQTLWHRITQTSRIKIDSPGSEQTEVVIDALSEKDAAWLRDQLIGKRNQQTQTDIPVVSGPILFRSIPDLLKWSLTINHLQTIGLVLIFGFTILNDLGSSIQKQSIDYVESNIETINTSFLVIGSLAFVILMITIVLSMAFIVYKYFEYTLISDSKGFNVRAGLIHVQQWSVPFRKIQVWHFRSNWIRRFSGWMHLEWKTIGEHHKKNNEKIWVPVFNERERNALLGKAGYSSVPGYHSGERIHSNFLFRFYMVGLILLVVALLICFQKSSVMGAVICIGVMILFLLHVLVYQRRFRFQICEDGLWVSKGIWGNYQIFMPWKNIQFVTLSQSVFQQEKQLATLYFWTAGGNIALPFISMSKAQEISRFVQHRLQTDQSRWN
jgi:putative membrane protein